MQRIIIHWNGGPQKSTGLDNEHYHQIMDGAGELYHGVHLVRANAGPLKTDVYVAHTLNAITGGIGVGLAGALPPENWIVWNLSFRLIFRGWERS